MEPAQNSGTESPKSRSSGVDWLFRVVFGLIILLLVAIAIPNFTKARTVAAKSACVANLKQIEGATRSWALENKKIQTDAVNFPEVVAYLKGGHAPECPAGGSYSPGINVTSKPTCTLAAQIPGHSLP